MTAATRVCWSMISETQLWYGSVVPRHGSVRACARYHAIKRCPKTIGSSSDEGPVASPTAKTRTSEPTCDSSDSEAPSAARCVPGKGGDFSLVLTFARVPEHTSELQS